MNAFRAALDGDALALKRWLQRRFDVTQTDQRGRTALHLAAEKGHQAAVGALLDAGADVHARDRQGHTPLYTAVHGKHVGVARQLLAADAAADAADIRGWTPLHVACDNGDAATLAMLLDRGVFANGAAASSGAQPPLHVATSHGALECMTLLVERGCGVDAPDKAGRTALHIAAATGDVEATALLIAASANLESADSRGWTPLHVAAHAGSSAVVNKLLMAGANARARSKHDVPPLRLAVEKEHSQVVQTLVMHVLADRESRQHTGRSGAWARRTMLPDVLDHRHMHVVRTIMASQFSPKSLCEAVNRGEVEVTQLLLEGGCSPRTTLRNRNLVGYCLLGLESIAFGIAKGIPGSIARQPYPFPLSSAPFRQAAAEAGPAAALQASGLCGSSEDGVPSCVGAEMGEDVSRESDEIGASEGPQHSAPGGLNDDFWELYDQAEDQAARRRALAREAAGGAADGNDGVEGAGELFDDEDLPERERVRSGSAPGGRGDPRSLQQPESGHVTDPMQTDRHTSVKRPITQKELLLREFALECVQQLENQEALLQFLVDAGAPVTTQPGWEQPVVTAAKCNSVAAVRTILGAGGNDIPKDALNDGFLLAAKHLDVEMLRALLDRGASPKAQQPKGETALHSALNGYLLRLRNGRNHIMGIPMSRQTLERDLASTCELLLRAGVDGSSVSRKSGHSALHKLALIGEEDGLEEVAAVMLLACAQPNIKDGQGHTPVHLAIKAGSRSFVNAYISAGLDVQLVDASGSTLLHWAATWRQYEIAVALVKAGVHPHARDGQGQTVLHVLGSLHEPLAWLQPPFVACMRMHDSQGRTPLHRCPACLRQAEHLARRQDGCCRVNLSTENASRTRQAEQVASRRGGFSKADDDPAVQTQRSVHCCCGGRLLSTAFDQDLQVYMLLAPELLLCPSKEGGRLGRLRCLGPASTEQSAGDSLALGWEGADVLATLADVPLDVRIIICQFACLLPACSQSSAQVQVQQE